MGSKKRNNRKDVIFIYYGNYKTGIDTNYSITFGFLERYFPSNYVVIKHSMYNGGETRIYPNGVGKSFKKVPVIGIIPSPFRYVIEFFYSSIYILLNRPKMVMGLNPLSSFAPCVLKSFGLLEKVIFINPDFARRRFKNSFLNYAYFKVDKYCTSHCTKNVCNSKYVISYKKKLYGDLDLTDKFFHMPNIPNPWEIKKYSSAEKVPGRIIYVGNISKQLDFENIINTIYQLKSADPETHLIVVGTGETKDSLVSYVKERGIDNVRFLGRLSHQDVLKEVARSEFGIAIYNGLLDYDEFRDSCKIREYQSLGCIPITSHVVKSNTEEIQNYDSGIFVDDVNDMYGVMEPILKNSVKREKLYRNAVLNNDVYSNKYDDFYKLCNQD